MYAAVARGAPKRPLTLPTLQNKHILTRHKCKIIVVQGKELELQKKRLYKELIEQLNKSWDRTRWGEAGDIVAICQLPSNDIVITMADKKARISWLADRKWLATLGEGACIKMREFTVIAHRIQVN